ncbi:MAG: protein kinase [Planctomycetes bacterium]|nr:protein kinase [Planctomycetota bacterium]
MTDRPDDEALDDLDDLDQVWDLGLQDLFDGRQVEADANSAEPVPGDRCGRFLLVEEIAQGGMGRVFRALDERLDRDVAVKVLRARLRRDDQMTARFLEEARIAGQLQHPGILPVYDVGLDAQDRPWFAMKLVEGRTLAEILRERGAPDEELARFLGILAAVCQAVGYAHSRGVVHRDLKPANVMIGPHGEVQVLDWGFAKVLQAARRAGRAAEPRTASGSDAPPIGSDSSRSVSGSVLGTPRYMAPEQARGEIESLDQRTDVFALGGILCEILCDQPPWGRGDDGSPLDRAARGDMSETAAALAGCAADPELIALARHCLAVVPGDRPGDAGVLAAALGDYLAAAEARTRQARVEAEAARASAAHERRARLMTLALGIVLVAVAAAVAWFVWRGDVERREDLARRRERFREALADAGDHLDRAEWSLAAESLTRARLVLGEPPAVALVAELDQAERQLENRRLAWEKESREKGRLDDFRSRLEAIRLSPMTEPGEGGEDYAACFADFGAAVIAHSPERSYVELAQLPADVREAVRLALDDWASRERAIEARRPPQPEGQHSDKLLQLAQFLDRDPWRRGLRAAVLERDEEALRRIAEDASRQGVDPKDALLLATTLQRDGQIEVAIGILMASWRRHPHDVWLSHHLARMLADGMRDPARRAADAELAIRHASIAMALGTDSPFLRDQLISLLLALGRRQEALAMIEAWRGEMDDARLGRIANELPEDEAVALLENALRDRPRSVELHLRLVNEYLRVADLEAAETALRRALAQAGDAVPLVCALAELMLQSGRLEEATRMLVSAGVDEESRRLRDRIARFRRAILRGGPLDLLSRCERAQVQALRGDEGAARDEWLTVLREGEARPRDNAPLAGRGLGPGIAAGGLGLGPRRLLRGPISGPRPPRQDALAALLASAAAGGAQDAIALLDRIIGCLDALRDDDVAASFPVAREFQAILRDRRLPALYDRIEELIATDDGGRLDRLRDQIASLARTATRPARPPEAEEGPGPPR